MASLRCNVKNCVSNNSSICNSENINIVGEGAHMNQDTYCRTFRESNFKNFMSNLNNVNYFGQVKQMFNTDSRIEPKIYCDAKCCYHNSLGNCTAQNINVVQHLNSDRSGIYCDTFIEAY